MKVATLRNIFQQNRNKKENNIAFGTTIKGFPTTVEIGISKNCNLSCSYCPNHLLKKRTPDVVMSIDLFIKVLKDLKAIDYNGIICFHRFNEPLMVNVEQYIKMVKKYLPKAKTELFTNGTLLTKKRLKSLQRTLVDEMVVTQQEQTKIGFLDKLDKIPKYLLKNVKTKYGSELNLINRAGVFGELKELSKEPCYSIHTTFAIDSDGKVPLCIDDYFRKSVLGNVNTETIEEIWNKPASKEIRAKLDNGEKKDIVVCQNCDRIQEKRILSQDLSKNNALYRRLLLKKTGSAHLPKSEKN